MEERTEMKTLVNCEPLEFLKQTNRIKKSVEKWLTDTDIMNIRKRMPTYEFVSKDATDEEKKAVADSNRKKREEQMKANLSAILDAILEQYPEETLEILALCCFIEPEDANNHKVGEYIRAFNALINDKDVLDFFISLASLAQRNTSEASKA